MLRNLHQRGLPSDMLGNGGVGQLRGVDATPRLRGKGESLMAESKKPASRKPTSRAKKPAASDPGEFSSSPEVRTALIDGNTFPAKAIQYAVVDGVAMFEGDIVLGTVEEVEQRSAQLRGVLTGELESGVLITGSQYRWPNCTIAYTIDAALTNQSRVTDAIAHWETNTRFNFVVQTSEANYVTFRPGSGCSSSVGMRGGQQFVNLGTGCSKGNVIHEIGHVVGMWHEQSREDRDAFVTINWAKIKAGFEHNFNQHIADGDDVGAYDYGSIMHYPRSAFSVDGTDTITPVNPTATIGQRTALSPGDISTANSMCPIVAKSPLTDPVFTRKEIVKDLRSDTRKEMIFDTRKEVIFDTHKEMIKDRIKEVAYDPPWNKGFADRGTPTNPIGPVVRPVIPGGGPAPFAVVTDHQAPGARDEARATAGQLDEQLVMIAEQIAQTESMRDQLQAQYDEMRALVDQIVQADDEGQL